MRSWTPKRLKRIYIELLEQERKTRDLCTVRYVKDEDHNVLVRDEEIKERGREYFHKLFNSSYTQDLDDLSIQCQDMNHNYMHRLANMKLKRP